MSQYCDKCGKYVPNEKFSRHRLACSKREAPARFKNVKCQFCKRSIATEAYQAHVNSSHMDKIPPLPHIEGYLRPGLSSTMTQARAIGFEIGEMRESAINRGLDAIIEARRKKQKGHE